MKIKKIKMEMEMEITYWSLVCANDRTRNFVRLSRAILKYRKLKRF